VNTGEVKLPRVQRHQRLVLINKPDPDMQGQRWGCPADYHIPDANVPDEGLCYVHTGWTRDGLRLVTTVCAFCGHVEVLVP
jgi:hypothetical protein